MTSHAVPIAPLDAAHRIYRITPPAPAVKSGHTKRRHARPRPTHRPAHHRPHPRQGTAALHPGPSRRRPLRRDSATGRSVPPAAARPARRLPRLRRHPPLARSAQRSTSSPTCPSSSPVSFGLRAACRLPVAPHRACWLTFFGDALLVALGSGFYHFSPANASLVWDRLPMTFAFTSLFAAVLGEMVSRISAAASCCRYCSSARRPLVATPRRPPPLLRRPSPRAHRRAGPRPLPRARRRPRLAQWPDSAATLAFTAEQSDQAAFAFTGGTFSGHSLKHLLAALACTAVAALSRRRTAGSIPAQAT